MSLLAGLGVVLALFVLAYLLGRVFSERGEQRWYDFKEKVRRRVGRPTPDARPIETIAADLRRLGTRFHGLPAHASYSKVEAARAGYDRALAECCGTLGITHLLGVLPVGPELDEERARVEQELADAGVRGPAQPGWPGSS